MKGPDHRSRRCFLKASSMLDLAVAFTPATIGKAFADSKSDTAREENPTAQTRATQPADKTTIRPLQRNWTEREYHKLIYYNQVDRGGHYAAWEQPQLFSEEVRAGFRPLRGANTTTSNR